MMWAQSLRFSPQLPCRAGSSTRTPPPSHSSRVARGRPHRSRLPLPGAPLQMAKDRRGSGSTPKAKKDGPKHSLDPGSRPKGGVGGFRSEATVRTPLG